MKFSIIDFQKKVQDFLDIHDISYKNLDLYCQAFVHRSAINEYQKYFPEHNERLEFLGDAVLELVMTEDLYRDFPERTEGWMTDVRSSLVRGNNLGAIASRLDFSFLFILSKGEMVSGGNKNISLLADVFEAFLGALYLDQGFEVAKDFLTKHVYSTLPDILSQSLHKDPKSTLQEISQSLDSRVPEYKIVSETGMDHEKEFSIEVWVQGKRVGVGSGSSKKKAQESAASNALGKESSWNNRTSK